MWHCLNLSCYDPMSKPKVILLGKLPPPYMGPAIATGILLNSDLKNRFGMLFLNTKANDSINTLGKWNVGKVFKNISIYARLLRMVIKHKPDLVLIPISQTTTGFIKDSLFIIIAKLFGRRVLVQLRGSNFQNWINGASGLTKTYVRFMLRRTQGVIVLGNKLRYLFEPYFKPGQIFVIPNGADYELPARSRQTGMVKILYLSNLLSSKGIGDVFDAIVILNEEVKKGLLPPFSVDLIGEWLHVHTKDYCLGLLEKYQLPIVVHSSEASKQKLQFLADADVFVFPPREPEGHPWSIVEAMAAGLPVISTDQGAITESVIDGTNGFIVAPGQPGMIAGKLRTLILDKSLREQMGKASRALYLTNFTEARMVDRYTDTFHALIKQQ